MPSDSVSGAHAAADPAANLRKKQILVAVLVIGLIGALLTQPEPEDESAPEVVEASMRSATVSVNAASAAPSVGGVQEEQTPKFDLSQIRDLSRLELPTIVQLELLAPEANQPQHGITSEVPEVQAVYGTSRGRAALVGKSIVRGGQPLPGGITVLGVTEEGIQVGQD